MKKTLMPILAAGLVALAGCEEGEKANNGQGRDNFNLHIPHPKTKEMHQGESSEVIADVNRGCAYSVYVSGSNDGPSDRISVYADDIKIGTYTTQSMSLGGRGWYVRQDSPSFNFTTTSDTIRLKVHIDSADSYGTSPNRFIVSRAAE